MTDNDLAKSIGICIAAFNRREKTLACLASLAAAERPDQMEVKIYLLDDASTDGTAEAVGERFPGVTVLTGTGSLYWAGGMRVAFSKALKHSHDFYVWMNDDVVALPDALVCLVETERRLCKRDGRHHLVTGGMCDPETGESTYGGYNVVSRLNPSRIELVLPSGCKPRHVDLTNANMLLIPAAIADELGNIPTWYTHTLGDWDYSLRAQKKGFGTTLAAGFVGKCEANIAWRRRWHHPSMGLIERYRAMLDPLALPFWARARFLISHFPITAPLFIFSPYLKLLFDHFRLRRQEAETDS